MSITRSSRFLVILFTTLVTRYRVALVGGLILGIAGSLAFYHYWPQIATTVGPMEHIGMVGEFTPSSLPLSIQKLISRGLTDIADDGSVIPALAKSWSIQDDGKTYIFTLDTSVSWHDGKKMEAEDVNYNIKNVTMRAVSPDTLRVTLDTAFSPFLTLVAKPIFLRGLRGVGPYKVSGIKLNGTTLVSIKLSPTHDTTLPSREYRFYKTEAQAITAYKLGSVDILEDIADPSAIRDWKNTGITQKAKKDRIVALYFNLRNDRLKDKSLRQALAYAVPDLGLGRLHSPIAQSSWAYSEKSRIYNTDLTRAKKLLGSEPSGSASAQLVLSTFSQYLDSAQIIAKSWSELGVEITVKVENAVPSDFQVLLSAQDIPPDPDQYQFWHQTQERTNVTGYKNVKIDKLLEDGRQELDITKRKAIYADFQRYLTDDVPAIFLYHPIVYTIKRK